MVPEAFRSPLTALPGIGPARAEKFRQLGVETRADLLLLIPRRYEDRSALVSLAQAAARGSGLVEVTVTRHEWFFVGRERVLKVVVADRSAPGALVCFGRPMLERTLPPGRTVRVWGGFALRKGEVQASQFELDPEEGIVPHYSATAGLTQRIIRRAIAAARSATPSPATTDIAEEIEAIHAPASIAAAEAARTRLAWRELLIFQLRLAREARRRRLEGQRRRPPRSGNAFDRLSAALPFPLTGAQRRAIDEIVSDLESPEPMSRLLQGDVGSGKTIVALLAACRAIDRGEQAALLVPTDLLARQHAQRAAALLEPLHVRVVLVTATSPGDTDRGDLIVGTHALFSEGRSFRALALVIVDEQHRFGVHQRETMRAKGATPDLLMMSATPIPRSLALTAFGDSDVSIIDELPEGRHAVRTRLARRDSEERVLALMRDHIAAGERIYVVSPAIEDDSRGLRGAVEMRAHLAAALAPARVGVVHGRMAVDERAGELEAFAAGRLDVLCATTVIEVGIDIPEATVIVIDYAERFGLAALHQLRGRVGRGARPGTCILMYDEPLTDDARERLRVLYESTDGFEIAEADLTIRGPGELEGIRQSGALAFRVADLRRDVAIMVETRHEVARIMGRDPGLLEPERAWLRPLVGEQR